MAESSARDLAATAPLPTLDDLSPLLLQVLDEDEAMSAFQVLTQGGYRIVTAAALAVLEKQAEDAQEWEKFCGDAQRSEAALLARAVRAEEALRRIEKLGGRAGLGSARYIAREALEGVKGDG